MRMTPWGLLGCAALLAQASVHCAAAIPEGYYASAEGKAGAELRQALYDIIRNHTVIPYSSSSQIDSSDALKFLDADPAISTNVLEIYSGYSVPASEFGSTTGWSREHQWCNTYGIDGVEPAYSDLFNLRPIDLHNPKPVTTPPSEARYMPKV